ncbi:MAG UNVERIFIED_CONTAM: hypothetical protein LVR29_14245 [Microcystis novacekii LVE1205-3]|jgi:hypothetical protein
MEEDSREQQREYQISFRKLMDHRKIVTHLLGLANQIKLWMIFPLSLAGAIAPNSILGLMIRIDAEGREKCGKKVRD